MKTIPATSTGPAPTLRHERHHGFDLTEVPRGALTEIHLTLRPLPGEQPPELARRLHAALRDRGAVVVKQDVFGSLASHEEFLRVTRRLFGRIDWPINWMAGASCPHGLMGGMHVMAVAGTEVETILLDGRAIGRVFSDAHARHCLIGDVRPVDITAPKAVQVLQAFEALEAGLTLAGMKFSNIVRTWLFIDNILKWYGPFNEARAEFFRERRVFDGLLPASTGIGVRNPDGGALIAEAWAVQPLNGVATAREVASPLQCPAPRYGSCFSRGVEMIDPGLRRLLVSGTASIEPGGETAHVGDVRKQIALTMDVVEAILVSCAMNYSDITRATAYFQKLTDAPHFGVWCSRHGLSSLPVVSVESDVCRDDLLFEIELDAITITRNGLE